jgi:hypothetical protein
MRTHYGRTIKRQNTIKRTLEEEEMEVLVGMHGKKETPLSG